MTGLTPQRRHLAALLFAGLCALLAGCSVNVNDDQLFTCSTDADCGGNGFTCVKHPSRAVCCQASEEVCDGVDNDCSGAADDLSCYGGDAGTAGVGLCRTGSRACEGTTVGACVGEVLPTDEFCNGLDDDCDGTVDEGVNTVTDPANCGACGTVCSNGQACVDAGCRIGTEGACGDNVDNDQDGRPDCRDSDCVGQICGQDGGCRCAADGGRLELNCFDGVDNDLDLFADCADRQSCPSGSACRPGSVAFACEADAGACFCNGSATTPDAGLERGPSCGNGLDEDCDGTIDCADPSCDGGSCNPDGGCVCTAGARRETVCGDGQDNNFTNGADCADGDCDGGSCNSDGGCVCTAGAPKETVCSDGTDNNFRNGVDCADDNCDGGSCNRDGGCVCSAGASREIFCADNVDNDFLGGADCLDTDCDTLSCGDGGRVCGTGQCLCNGVPSPPAEAAPSCGNGLDDDCDTLTDCAETVCNGQACNSTGRTCDAGMCRCLGVLSPAAEAGNSCADVADNDCDGTIDCDDVGCDGGSCNPIGGCQCLSGVKAERECRNAGIDEDGDGLINCLDPDCVGRTCAGGGRTCAPDGTCP